MCYQICPQNEEDIGLDILAHRKTGQKGSLVFSLARRCLIKPEGLQTAIHRLLSGES